MSDLPSWSRRAVLCALPVGIAGALTAGGLAVARPDLPWDVEPRLLRARYPIGFGRPRVVVDAGHGGRQPGAVRAWSVAEKEINLRVAMALAERLRAGRFAVSLTRDSDTTVSLARRYRRSNRTRGRRVAFVSIHANAGSGGEGSSRGSMVIWSSRQWPRVRRRSQRLAHVVGAAIGRAGFPLLRGAEGSIAAARRQGMHYVASCGRHGVFATARRRLSVLDHNRRPAVLVETHFLDNPAEVAAFQTDDAIDRFCRALEVALITYFA